MSTQATSPFAADEALSAEHRRLTGLCAHLTGSAYGAEDLAQEVLLIAWRHEHHLRSQERRWPWLAGIARNVCRAAVRRRARGLTDTDSNGSASLERLADGDDLELELERDELAQLLDRAMAKLPAETRNALVWRYVEELPRAEVAARLGLSEGAVAMRLQRGKLTLRRLLATDFRLEAEPYGVDPCATWQETRMWCPVCGVRRLAVRMNGPNATCEFRCPDCCPEPDDTFVAMPMLADTRKLKSPRSILTRQTAWFHTYCQRALAGHDPICEACGSQVRVERYDRGETVPPWGRYGARVHCEGCRSSLHATVTGLAIDVPEAQRFWREHGKIRTLPERDAVADGQPALITTLESLNSDAALDVVVAAGSYSLLGVQRRAR